MLDADDAILEQAMQTVDALKRARDNQKAARKQRVSSAAYTGSVFQRHAAHFGTKSIMLKDVS